MDDQATSQRALPEVTNLDSLRRVEGAAPSQCFSGLYPLVRPDRRAAFSMDGRTRRPLRGRFNAMWMRFRPPAGDHPAESPGNYLVYSPPLSFSSTAAAKAMRGTRACGAA